MCFCVLIILRPPRPTRFPSTTLGRSHARADIGQPEQLEHALHGAVLAVRSMQDREYDVDVAENADGTVQGDRKSTLLNSSHANISYAVFCLNKKTTSSPMLFFTTLSI